MQGCGLFGFDLSMCAWSLASGLAGIVPWWAWIAMAVAGVGVAYRIGGWPAVAALAFGYGVLWGGRVARGGGRDDAPRAAAPRRKRPTLMDLFSRKR